MKVEGPTTPAASEPQPPAKNDSIGELIEKMKPQIGRALPKHVTADRLARVALTAVRNNPKLAATDGLSLMGAIMMAAQLGLEPNTPLGECYLIPYRDNRANRTDAQFQLGYKGVLALAHRSGQYRQITAHSVDEADKFEYEYGLTPKLVHKPADRPTGKVVRYYAVYHLTNGGFDFQVWSKEKAEAHGKRYSKSFSRQDSPWKTNFDQMAKKSVLLDLLKTAPKSVELARASSTDNMTPRFNDADESIDIKGDFEFSKDDLS